MFDTEDGKKTLAELFDGRSQLLAYNVMFGPDYEIGACPGCTASRTSSAARSVQLNHRDVSLICFSARRSTGSPRTRGDGLGVPVRIDLGTDFPFEFGLADDPRAGAAEIPEVKSMIDSPPEWLTGLGPADRGQARGRPARGSGLDRLRSRQRHHLPHLYGDGARSVRRALSLVPVESTKLEPSSEVFAWRKDEYPDS